MSSVSYIDEARNFRVFRLCANPEQQELAISKTGASSQLLQRLRYAKTMVERLQSTRSTSCRVKTHRLEKDDGLNKTKKKPNDKEWSDKEIEIAYCKDIQSGY